MHIRGCCTHWRVPEFPQQSRCSLVSPLYPSSGILLTSACPWLFPITLPSRIPTALGYPSNIPYSLCSTPVPECPPHHHPYSLVSPHKSTGMSPVATPSSIPVLMCVPQGST